MSSISSVQPLGSRRALSTSIFRRVADESLLLTVVVAFAVFVAVSAAPYMLWGDSWMTFLGGREVAAHGIPGVDTLTVLTRGREWVDQQWLAQLATYEFESAFGLQATLALFAAMIIVPFVLACRFARIRGASPRSVAVFALLGSPAALCAVRAQAFSYFLFVPFLALLVAEARRPSRRVWLTLPLIALWANVHGAVLVAAALASLLGLAELLEGKPRRRALGLLLLPWPCVFVSPYGLSLVGYYHSTAGNPLFKKFILEWAPPMFPTAVGLPFFLTAGVGLVLLARRPRELTLFEHGALALTLLGGLTAERSITWFSYAALLLLPAVLERAWPQPAASQALRHLLGAVTAATVVLGLAATASAAAHASARIRSFWPPEAVRAVRQVLAADPHARVLAAEGSADWLLFELPGLRGKIAFDNRFEVLSLPRFRLVRDYLKQSGPGWDRLSRGYRVIVVDPRGNKALYRTYEARGLRMLFRNDHVAVFDAARRR